MPMVLVEKPSGQGSCFDFTIAKSCVDNETGGEYSEKAAFFKELSELDNEDEGPEDTSGASELLASSRKEPRVIRSTVSTALHETPVLNRAILVPLSKSHSPWSEHVSIVKETPYITRQPSTTARQLSAGKMKASKKRKRGKSLELVPESQQVFRGLIFCM